MISLPIKLSTSQYNHLREVKEEHGISMASQIRTMIKHQMYGTGNTGESYTPRERNTTKKKALPVAKNTQYASCMTELKAVLAKRNRRDAQ